MSFNYEPERYELTEPARYRFEVDRRDFLRLFTAMGGGLIVVAALPVDAQESGRGGQRRGAATSELASWLHVGEDGRVTVYTGKVEIGQNIRTSLAQAVADELAVALPSITMEMADTDLTPFDQGTFGSRTTPTMAPVLARAAAAARRMLIEQAAAQWRVPAAGLHAKDGHIVDVGGRSIAYGELTRGQKLTGVVPAGVEVEPASEWTVRGRPAHKVNGREIVTGQHAYTPDVQREGVLMGRIVRPAAYGATIQSVDDAKTRGMAGVSVVRDGEFLGVVAPNERVARQAASGLNVRWKMPTGLPSSDTVYDHLRKTASRSSPRANGDTTSARAKSARTLDATYEIPYIAHVPLEPRSAVAEWSDGKLTVWTGTQRPFGVRGELASAFHLSEDQVRVIVPDMGSGYGGKHTGECAVEAARLAKAAGRPVKLVYTRAEEFWWGYFRPAGVIDVAAGIDGGGRLTFWEFDNYNSGGSGLNTPYVVANTREAFHQSDSPLRQGSYRGLAATANHYAREMHMDAMARAAGADAVEFRLKHIDDDRLRAVLTAAAEHAGWPRAPATGRALGIACGLEKGGYVATAAELSKTPDGFAVERLVVVFECGAIVNPDGLRNQVEGAAIMGLGGALFEAVEFADGQILNGTMAQYRVPRFKDVPPIEVVLLDRKDLPSAGAGETPIVCVAPAIGSAARAFGSVATKLPVTLT